MYCAPGPCSACAAAMFKPEHNSGKVWGFGIIKACLKLSNSWAYFPVPTLFSMGWSFALYALATACVAVFDGGFGGPDVSP